MLPGTHFGASAKRVADGVAAALPDGVEDSATHARYGLDAAGRLVWANAALARLLGHASVEELLAARSDFRVGLYDDPGHAAWLEDWAQRHGRLCNAEAVVLCADGHRRVIAEDVRILRGAGQEKQGE